MISISIVSHGHGPMVSRLLADIETHCSGGVEVILTENVPEPDLLERKPGSVPVKIIRNTSPRGFGANHNAAFREARGDFFCVLNPDVRLPENPFPTLIGELNNQRVGVAAPLIVSPAGEIEDSARRFPTLLSLFRKTLRSGVQLDYAAGDEPFSPDWIAGIFMLFRHEVFRDIGGFDERYFLYYEDVDLCARLRLAGYDIRVNPKARVVHDARRQSHRDPRHLARHLRSTLRFFLSKPCAEISCDRRGRADPQSRL